MEKPLHQSVFLADNIFEQMGAYVVFRRTYYIGECDDFKKTSFEEAIALHFKKRLDRFRPDSFPERFQRLVNYQYNWVTGFFDKFQKGESWARELADFGFEKGKEKTSLEECIKEYKPSEKNGKEIKTEAQKYIEGRKFSEFEKLV